MRNSFRDSSLFARVVAVGYAAAVISAMSLSFWPNVSGVSGLVAMLLSLPWGLGIILLLDTIDRSLVEALGPPLVAICGFLNAFLLYNVLRGRPQ